MYLFTNFNKWVIFSICLITYFFHSKCDAQQKWNFYESTDFEKYHFDNVKLGELKKEEKRVVFMGNSITESWPLLSPRFFEHSKYKFIGRGISGQTTPQMLLRFRRDIIALKPNVVVILAGINDIAQNTGFTPVEVIAENIMSMAELAQFHDIEVIICSVLPALDFPWNPGLEPATKILALNTILRDYANRNELIYLDYHSAMKDENNGLKVPDFTTANDLVHPNSAGYNIMESLVMVAIEQALAK